MARAMALTLEVPVVGVSTLVAFAAPLLDELRQGVVVAAIDAKHGGVYVQAFESSGRPLFAPRIASLRDAIRAIGAGPARMAGDGAKALALEGRRAGLVATRPPRPIPTLSRSRGSPWQRTPPIVRRTRSTSSPPTRGRRPAKRSRARTDDRTTPWFSDFAAPRRPPSSLARRSRRGMRRHHASALRSSLVGRRHRGSAVEPPALASAALDPATSRMRGFAISRLAADEAELLTIAVEPAWRGRGVGRDLLREHLSRAALSGARAMFLEVDHANAAAIALYARFGFRKVGERDGYYRRSDGKPATALVMRKDLA